MDLISFIFEWIRNKFFSTEAKQKRIKNEYAKTTQKINKATPGGSDTDVTNITHELLDDDELDLMQ